jgi:hypothetical protein
VVKGDPVFSKGNLHGADFLPREGRAPLVAVADNVDGEIYVSDTSFGEASVLGWPGEKPYSKKEEFHPTDVAFVDGTAVYVTDGYGAGFSWELAWIHWSTGIHFLVARRCRKRRMGLHGILRTGVC